ncbi:MAG: peptide deformylase [Clostridia bacterium]|nr:peptide deformylase [Clostridia bacterium]
MGLRNIRVEGDEILKKKSKEVDVIDDKIKDLIKDMIDTMHKYDGVGLAAVQVGILKRIIVIDLYDEKPILKLINPVIVKTKGKQEVEEGCLSFPNKYVKAIRPEEVVVEALDENGKKIKVTGTGLLAQALSHEMDHLSGVVLTDVMIPGTMELVEPDENERKNK